MKKRKVIIFLILLIVAIVIVVFCRSPKSYEVEYSISDYEIVETYEKDESYYGFSLKVDGKTFDFAVKDDYLHRKKLIQRIDVASEENETCVLLKSDYIDLYPLCVDDEGFVDMALLEHIDESFFSRERSKVLNEKYWNIDVNVLNGNSYLIWASKGYYYINENISKELMFLENDSYYNNLAIQVGRYVLTPDYDQDYAFSKMYIIDMETGKYSTWDLEYEISYNSYYLGVKDSKAYIVDVKNKVEYSLNPKKKKIEVVSKDGYGKVWSNGWNSVSLVKLASGDYEFEGDEIYNYSNLDGKLNLKYINSKNYIRVSDASITKIVSQEYDKVYYLSKSSLYEYSLKYGEVLLLEYSEWNFNNINSVYIY